LIRVLLYLTLPNQDHQIPVYNKKNKEYGKITVWYQFPGQAHGRNHAKPYSLARLKDLGIITTAIRSSKVQTMPPAWTNLLFSLGTLIQLSNSIAQVVQVIGP
jgi:hypothetical protein